MRIPSGASHLPPSRDSLPARRIDDGSRAAKTPTQEKGEIRASSIFSLVVFAAVCLAAWNVAPVYIDNYALQDKMNEIARAPRWTGNDEKLTDNLMKYVREKRLEGYIKRSQFTISTVETNRRITVQYQRAAQILPGWNHTFAFNIMVEQPLI